MSFKWKKFNRKAKGVSKSYSIWLTGMRSIEKKNRGKTSPYFK